MPCRHLLAVARHLECLNFKSIKHLCKRFWNKITKLEFAPVRDPSQLAASKISWYNAGGDDEHNDDTFSIQSDFWQQHDNSDTQQNDNAPTEDDAATSATDPPTVPPPSW